MKIGVLTSGGDSPGMNACIRSVVRKARAHDVEVMGVMRGYSGLVHDDLYKMTKSSVSNIIQKGGTILKTARCLEFFQKEGRLKAYETCTRHELDALVVIGGDGTFTGASIFQDEFGIRMIGIPGTIDNDLYGTDYTIGYDTALNTVIEAVDKIRDTAQSHDRIFIVEVMGKDAGFIALRSGIAAGAEAILVPETPTYTRHLLDKLEKGWRASKKSSIVIVAEGDESGGASEVAKVVKKEFPDMDVRVSILGHIQRGGNPSAMDRVLASRLGVAAIDCLLQSKSGIMVGVVHHEISEVPFDHAIKHHKELHKGLLELAEILSL